MLGELTVPSQTGIRLPIWTVRNRPFEGGDVAAVEADTGCVEDDKGDDPSTGRLLDAEVAVLKERAQPAPEVSLISLE